MFSLLRDGSWNTESISSDSSMLLSSKSLNITIKITIIMIIFYLTFFKIIHYILISEKLIRSFIMLLNKL